MLLKEYSSHNSVINNNFYIFENILNKEYEVFCFKSVFRVFCFNRFQIFRQFKTKLNIT
jgi:hypothetical protein